VDRPKQVGRPPEVLDRDLEEGLLGSQPAGPERRQGLVVERRVLDREVEDRGVARQPRDVEVADVTGQRAVIEHPAADLIEPEALADMGEAGGGSGHGRLLW